MTGKKGKIGLLVGVNYHDFMVNSYIEWRVACRKMLFFGSGQADGTAEMRNLLGGKGQLSRNDEFVFPHPPVSPLQLRFVPPIMRIRQWPAGLKMRFGKI